MLEIKNISQKLQKSYVGKAGTIARNEFGIFETMLFRENSEKLEPQIRKNWSRPFEQYSSKFCCRPGVYIANYYVYYMCIKHYTLQLYIFYSMFPPSTGT